MKKLLMLVLILASAELALAAAPTAHNPQYQDRSTWPAWVEQTDFVKEQWPEARVLVWAKTQGTMRNLDLADAQYWLEDGNPAKRGPDADTDVIFPSGEKEYGVFGEGGCPVRHVTVEPGVRVGVRMFNVHGNVWIKHSSWFSHIRLGGSKNTFMRSDQEKPNFAANKIAFNRKPDSSVEWIGTWLLNDELDLMSGRFIVAPGSTFLPGDRSSQRIYPDATLILTSGSTFEKRAMQYALTDVQVTGKLLAGTPERPLTADATLGLSAKMKQAGVRNAKPSDRGLILYKEGTIAVHSANPQEARLVVRRNMREASSYDMNAEEEKLLPKGIDMILLGTTEFNGVELKDVLKGGILMPDPSAASQWKHVKLGDGNAGPLDELLAKHEGGTGAKMDDQGVAGPILRKHREQQTEKRE